MGDQQPGRGIGGAFTANLTPLLDFLTLHRTSTATPGEVARLTVVGWPPGRTVRVAKLLAATVVLVLAIAIGSQFVATSFALGLAIGLLAAGACLGMVQVVTGRAPAGGWNPVAIVLTNRRLIIANGSSRGPILAREDPAADVTWARIDVVESIWLRNVALPVVTFGGPAGPAAALELPKVDIAAVEALVHDAGLRLVPSTAP